MAGGPVQEDDRLISWLQSRARSSSSPTEFVDKLLVDVTEDIFGLCQESTSVNVFHCSCGSILYNPSTLKDGSSQCKSCMIEQEKSSKLASRQCSRGETSSAPRAVNVALARVIRKCCSDRVAAVEIRMRGCEAVEAGDGDRAVELYTEALQLAPDDPVTRVRRSEALALKGRYQETLEDSNIALALSPRHSKTHYHKGRLLDSLGQAEDSLASYLAGLVLDKDKTFREHVVKALSCYISTEREEHLSDSGLQKLRKILHLCRQELISKPVQFVCRPPDILALEDLDCVLCCKLLYKPVTTPCGHVFCQSCLNRALDYRPSCPACRGSLAEYLSSILGRNQPVTLALERIIQHYFPDEYAARDQQYVQELRQLAGPRLGSVVAEADIPVLVCAPAFPSVRSLLHIFKPCYRLMLRRCLESKSYQFGMCERSEQSQLAHVGTMLIVRGVQFIADGRSTVDAMGGKRFRVLRYGMLDGYGRAVVRFFSDHKVPPGPELSALRLLCVRVHEVTKDWFLSLSSVLKDQVTTGCGEMPVFDPASDFQAKDDGPDWVWWACAALHGRFQAANALALTSLKDRLLMLQHLLDEQASVARSCRSQ